MSVVCNIIFICNCIEEDVLKKTDPYFKEMGMKGLSKIENCDVGGYKCLEIDVYIGAFNYMGSPEDFIEYVKKQDWSPYKNNIMIIIKDEHDEGPVAHEPFKNHYNPYS